MKVALDEANGKCNDLRGRLEEAEERMREMQAAHEVEKVELRDYYQNAMGQLDNNQKIEADQRIKEEEERAWDTRAPLWSTLKANQRPRRGSLPSMA